MTRLCILITVVPVVARWMTKPSDLWRNGFRCRRRQSPLWVSEIEGPKERCGSTPDARNGRKQSFAAGSRGLLRHGYRHTTLECRHDSSLARLDTFAGRLGGEVSHPVLRKGRLPAIPSSTRAIPSLARGTAVPMPSTLRQNGVFRLAEGPEAGLIAPAHRDDRCRAWLRDGTEVGIRPISGQQGSVLAHERLPPVDNGVGKEAPVSGALVGSGGGGPAGRSTEGAGPPACGPGWRPPGPSHPGLKGRRAVG